jgi:hypothetical protein
MNAPLPYPVRRVKFYAKGLYRRTALGTKHNVKLGVLWDKVIPDEQYQLLKKCGQSREALEGMLVWQPGSSTDVICSYVLKDVSTLDHCFKTLLCVPTKEVEEFYQRFIREREEIEAGLRLLI